MELLNISGTNGPYAAAWTPCKIAVQARRRLVDVQAILNYVRAGCPLLAIRARAAGGRVTAKRRNRRPRIIPPSFRSRNPSTIFLANAVGNATFSYPASLPRTPSTKTAHLPDRRAVAGFTPDGKRSYIMPVSSLASSDIMSCVHGGSNTRSTSASTRVGIISNLVRASSTRMSPMPQPGAVKVSLT